MIRQLAFDRIYVIGHSMGGAVGVIATQGNSSIECLISADGNLVAEDCWVGEPQDSRSIFRDLHERRIRPIPYGTQKLAKESFRSLV